MPLSGGSDNPWTNAVEDQPLQIFQGLSKEFRIGEGLAGDRIDLAGEIGVVLGGGPQGKDQVVR